MKNEGEKKDFDLSVLTLNELINLYENIDLFLQFLDDKIILEEEKGVV